jgi:hypothetical protein
MVFIEVLVDLEQTGFTVVPGAKRLAQGGQVCALDHHDGSVDLADNPDGALFRLTGRGCAHAGLSLACEGS